MKVRDSIAVDPDGMVSGLFVWDDDQHDFRNVHIDELKNPLFDLVTDKEAYFSLLLRHNTVLREQVEKVVQAAISA